MKKEPPKEAQSRILKLEKELLRYVSILELRRRIGLLEMEIHNPQADVPFIQKRIVNAKNELRSRT